MISTRYTIKLYRSKGISVYNYVNIYGFCLDSVPENDLHLIYIKVISQ